MATSEGDGYWSDEDLNNFQSKPRVERELPKEDVTGFITYGRRTRDPWTAAKNKLLLSNCYRYTALKDNEIRLLKIRKGDANEDILCTLHTKPLHEVRRKYEALSYHWGASSEEEAKDWIWIRDPGWQQIVQQAQEHAKGRKTTARQGYKWFRIHSNLYMALQHLRKEADVLLWVDAICINQRPTPEGQKEKSEQIQRMAEIYNSAYNVCIWLGDGQAHTDEAMEFIKEIVNLNNFDHLIRDRTRTAKWQGFKDLMEWEWFSRRWVVQEVAVARRASVHCGYKTVDWNDFSDAVALFSAKLEQIRTLFDDREELGDVEGYGAFQLVDAISNLSRRSAEGDIQEQLVGLEALVSRLLFFSTGNPRDAIYSLLSLASDTPQKYSVLDKEQLETESTKYKTIQFNIKVDYNKNPIEIFKEFTKLCIETSKSLDIICRHWAPDIEGEEFPSWISRISDSTYGTPEIALTGGRLNGVSLVGAPLRNSRKAYNASRGTEADVRWPAYNADLGWPQAHNAPRLRRRSTGSLESSIGSLPSAPATPMPLNVPSSTILEAKGSQLATISEASGEIMGGYISRKWLKYGWQGWPEDARSREMDVPDKLWRTLVADRDPNGDNPPGWYRRACLQCLTTNGIVDVQKNLSVSGQGLRRKSYSDIMMLYLKRARDVVWHRRFFLAKHKCLNCNDDGHQTHTCKRPTAHRLSSTASVIETLPATASRSSDTEPLYGLAPAKANVGDIICILLGCTVPVVLRKRESSNGDKFYQLIGEAFVYGKMDGEAMAGLDREGLKDRLRSYALR